VSIAASGALAMPRSLQTVHTHFTNRKSLEIRIGYIPGDVQSAFTRSGVSLALILSSEKTAC
jgi:hypothetical protein